MAISVVSTYLCIAGRTWCHDVGADERLAWQSRARRQTGAAQRWERTCVGATAVSVTAQAGRRDGQAQRQERGDKLDSAADESNGGERGGGERGSAADERDGESAADEGGDGERDSGERGGATDERDGDGVVAVSGAAHGESVAGRRNGRARRQRRDRHERGGAR